MPPPTNTRYRVYDTGDGWRPYRFTGRIHAAPTNRPETAGKRVKQVFAADIPARERGRSFRTGARMSRTGSKETVL